MYELYIFLILIQASLDSYLAFRRLCYLRVTELVYHLLVNLDESSSFDLFSGRQLLLFGYRFI